MKLHFDTNEDGTGQARGIVAMLHNLFGDAVLPTATAIRIVGNVKGDTVKAVEAAATAAGVGYAPDGHPTEQEDTAEPDAAAAFGTPSTSTEAPERDKDGIPWDERIHASTKTTNKDGTWTRRRNTPDDVFDKVMAELKAANTTRTMEAAAGLVPTPSAPAVAPSVPLPPTTAVPAPPTASPAPSPAPAAPAASSTAPAVDFPSVMVKITKAQSTGKITAEEINNLLLSVGATGGVIALNKNPSLIPAFDALLEDHLASAA